MRPSFENTLEQNFETTFLKKVAKYWAALKIGYFNATTYSWTILARGLTIAMRIWIYSQLYGAIFRTNALPVIDGLSLTSAVWLIMLTQSFQNVARPPVTFIVEQEVKNGDIAYTLNRPYSYIFYYYFNSIGRGLFALMLNIVFGAAVAVWMVGVPGLTWEGLLLGLVSLMVGIYLDFMIMMSIGLAAFWIEEVRPLHWIYSKFILVLGGMVVPVQFLPEAARNILNFLPFSNIFFLPANTMVNFNWESFCFGLMVQVCWAIIATVTAFVIFKFAEKHITVNGG